MAKKAKVVSWAASEALKIHERLEGAPPPIHNVSEAVARGVGTIGMIEMLVCRDIPHRALYECVAIKGLNAVLDYLDTGDDLLKRLDGPVVALGQEYGRSYARIGKTIITTFMIRMGFNLFLPGQRLEAKHFENLEAVAAAVPKFDLQRLLLEIEAERDAAGVGKRAKPITNGKPKAPRKGSQADTIVKLLNKGRSDDAIAEKLLCDVKYISTVRGRYHNLILSGKVDTR